MYGAEQEQTVVLEWGQASQRPERLPGGRRYLKRSLKDDVKDQTGARWISLEQWKRSWTEFWEPSGIP